MILPVVPLECHMKRFLYIIASLIMVPSCGTATRIYSNVLDYRSYTENGFFISPNPYPEAHQTIGEITITVYPGTKGRKSCEIFQHEEHRFSDPLYSAGGKDASLNSGHPTISEALLEMCVRKAEEMGANGISNFKCSVVYNARSGVFRVDHYEVYGLGILIDE